MNDRDQREELFQFNHRILAYFGVDLYEAIKTTHLLGEKTFFMPFNQGSNGAGKVGGKGNPPASTVVSDLQSGTSEYADFKSATQTAG